MRRKFSFLVSLSEFALLLLVGCATPASGPSNNPTPDVNSISPSTGTVGSATFMLTVNGADFVSGAVIDWNGTPLTTTFASSTQLSASVPASDLNAAGTAQVTVVNPAPGGGTSSAQTFNINNPMPVVSALSQNSVGAGSGTLALMVNGSGFVAASVVQWNGSARPTTFGGGGQLTVNVPASDLAFAGSAQITVANPTPGGGNSSPLVFTIAPQIANGNPLAGAPNTPAISSITDMRDTNVDGGDIVDGTVMTRLDVLLTPTATVGQVNNALGSIGAGVVSMSAGLPWITIGIPLQSSVAGLQALLQELEGSAGIELAKFAPAPVIEGLFPTGGASLADAATQAQHLLPSRFPAAWNLAPAALGNPSNPTAGTCAQTAVPVMVVDYYYTPASSIITDLLGPIQLPDNPPPRLPASYDLGHGYVVSEVTEANGFGANPFGRTSGCAPLEMVQLLGRGLTENEIIDNVFDNMPPSGTRFVVNYSIGYVNQCKGSPCQPPTDVMNPPLSRGMDALYWKQRTESRWDDFLVVVAAGNDANKESTTIYPGMGDARYGSFFAVSEQPDNQFQFVGSDGLWTPNATKAALGFTTLKAGATQQGTLAQAVQNAGLTGPEATADNVIVVGSTTGQPSSTLLTQHVTADQLPASGFSNQNPDVLAVGENVMGSKQGTSFAAPAVAGLISYLWLLSPDLRNNQGITITKNAIVANARGGVIDAYASVLSLDPAAAPNGTNLPIRQALLDVNKNNQFDEGDLDMFLRHFFVVDGQGNITNAAPPAVADLSRFDLNGDGFTTSGSLRERFDLDRTGSTQYGASVYTDVTEDIEGVETNFDENELTDLQILCYYAYSPMYSGDTDARRNLLAGRCNMAVQPATVMLSPGQTQQFTATAPSNDPVTWSASCGSIDMNGFYTAPSSGGSCTVTAMDADNSGLSATAAVTVSAGVKIELFEREYSFGDISQTGSTQTQIDLLNATYQMGTSTYSPAPTAALSDSVAGVYNYTTSYTDDLSASEVSTNSISSAKMTLRAHVSSQSTSPAPGVPDSVQSSGTATLALFPADSGPYLVTVTGQLSFTAPRSGHSEYTLQFRNTSTGFVPTPHCNLVNDNIDLTTCQISTDFTDFAAGQQVTRNFSFTGGALYMHASALVLEGASAQADGGDVQIQMTISIQRVTTGP